MASLKDVYLDRYGNPLDAAAGLARDLIRGDPVTFKAGYSPESAVLTVQEYFALDAAHTEAVRKLIQHVAE